MGVVNFIKLRNNCPNCGFHGEFTANISSAAWYGGMGKDDGYYSGEYEIGDVLRWYSEEESPTWPGNYAFVFQYSETEAAVIDPGISTCPSCKKRLVFYILINNRRIIRVLGSETDDLNMHSVIK